MYGNRAAALWARPKAELTDTTYIKFYRHIAAESGDPLAWIHAKIKGTYEHTLLLFIPAHAPFGL